MLTFTNSLIVRYAETDAMQRAHHSNFLIWFETCRIDLFNHLGLPYDAIELKGYYIPVLSAKVDYLKPVQFNQTININCGIFTSSLFNFYFNSRCQRQTSHRCRYSRVHPWSAVPGSRCSLRTPHGPFYAKSAHDERERRKSIRTMFIKYATLTM